MKFHILIYGCQMNYADSSRIRAVLENAWMEYSQNIKQADIVVFDTCSVKQKAEDKITWKLQEIWKNQKIWITGCMVQHNMRYWKINKLINKDFKTKNNFGNFFWITKSKNPKIIWLSSKDFDNIEKGDDNMLYINHAFNPMFVNLRKKFKNLELFFRVDDISFLPLILRKLNYDVKLNDSISNEYQNILSNYSNQFLLKSAKTSFVPISTWCNQFCSYCIVPYARWLERHRNTDKIIDEVKNYLDNGVNEICLLWQIVNKHPDFSNILQEILKLKWLKWLRYTSPYPTFYNKEIFQLHENEEKLCPHIHIPVQSWSNKILKKMFRWYTVEQFKEFIDQIKSLKRNISITTDMIIWFPDETEEDFKQSLDLIKYSDFDMIYMSLYSPRPWTYWAKNYSDNIPYKIKHNRWSEMNELLNKLSLSNNQKEIWNTKEMMISWIEKNNIIWYIDNMKSVLIQKPKDISYSIWEFVKVEVTEAESLRLKWIIKK